MADTKQATAETACERCGLEIWDKFDGLNGSHWRTKSTGGFCIKSADGHVPRTQPSQAELRIPDDLTPLYQMAKQDKAWIRSGFDHISDGGARISMWDLTELIERIARLEGGR